MTVIAASSGCVNDGGGGSDGGSCVDADGDGFFGQAWCGPAPDCDDGDSAAYPGAPELCDGIDNQCPGDVGHALLDEGCATPMALIPAGCFEMGDGLGDGSTDERPAHGVCVSADFYLDVHETTNSEYQACVAATACAPPGFANSYSRPSYYGNPAYDLFPVIAVDWNQATAYCAWAGKRLPTEAQWEYAARGGLAGKRYPWGDLISGADANYWDSGDPWDNDTSPVEYYPPNGYGLRDMSGNVWEWVSDFYLANYYDGSPTSDPTGPAPGVNHVVRGGSFSVDAHNLRASDRLNYDPTVYGSLLGFRCARD